MLFLVWYDADARRTVGEKIQDARTAYTRRFSAAPNLVLVNSADMTTLDEIEVRSERTVQPHHFWVGRTDEGASEAGAPGDG
ncbi:MAG TPA: hypothetical protein PKD53_18745 [Chloroflexaceae bacterium]|nr:hypothetical protein [Chloroflexaceae bacterium]